MTKTLRALISNSHVKKFIGFSTASFIGILLTYFATFFLNRTLSKEEMGSYSYVFNLLNLIYPIISLSTSSGYVRFINTYKNDLLIHYVKKFSLISTLFFCFIIALWFSNYYYLAFASIILYQERLVLARAKLEILKYNFLNIIQKILFLLFLFYERKNISAETALFFLGMSYFISYLMAFIWKENTFSSESSETEMDKTVFLKFCAVTMLTVIVHWMLTVSDQVIIKYYYGYEALAPYAVAYRIVTILSFVSGIFLSYYPSVYFKEIATKKVMEVLLLRKYFVLILILATAGVLIFKNSVYLVLGAANYISESGYFLPLLLGEMCRIVASVLMTYLTFKLQQTYILISMFTIAVLNIVLNIILVPYWGPLAAAYCTLICFILYLGVSFLVSYIPERRYIMTEVLG